MKSIKCNPVTITEPFQFKKVVYLEDDAPLTCSTKLNAEQMTVCQGYTKWTGYTGSAEQFLQGAANVAYKFINKSNPNLATKVYNGIGIGANIFYGANQQFIAAITDINAGKPYSPIIIPDNPPPFAPPPSKGDSVEKAIEAFWNSFKPWLEDIIGNMAKKEPSSPWIKILEGVVEASDLWIKQLKAIFQGV